MHKTVSHPLCSAALLFACGFNACTQTPDESTAKTESQSIASETECTAMFDGFSACPTLLAGRITAIHNGISTRSLPPQNIVGIELDEVQVLRAGPGYSPDAPVKIRYVGQTSPVAPGDRVILGSTQSGEPAGIVCTKIKVVTVTPKTIEACWKTYLAAEKAKHPQTQLAIPDAVQAEITGVPPAHPRKYVNDYGDGAFTLTLTNRTDAPLNLTLPFQDGKFAPEAVCIVTTVSDNQEHHFMTGSNNITFRPIALAPGESVSGTLNCLKLTDMNWPQGGARVYFTTRIGDWVLPHFFYYMDSHHRTLIPTKNTK